MLALAALFRVRSVYHLHMGRLPEIISGKSWEWWGMRWALRLADRVVVLDGASEQALRTVLPAGRVVRLPNAISITAAPARSAPSAVPTVLYLGYISRTKGMAELVAAWRKLDPQGWRLRLAGLGTATYQRELLTLAGSEVDFQFLGDLPHERAWTELLAADVFVLPSYTEGFPNVILEAMAAGKAIVSTRVGAIVEILDADGDEPCGLLVEPRDVGALAAALKQVMSDSGLRATLGTRARAKVERCYATEVVFPQLLGLWHNAAGRTAGTGGIVPLEQCPDPAEQR
jgi:glycosyltransferase involved in cell wall biosynthesis